MGINNYYNFKNPIRHFFNLDNLIINHEDLNINKLSWTEPITFRIRKDTSKFRALKMPNILNFSFALKECRELEHFYSIRSLDQHKRIKPNLQTGDFAVYNFSESLADDFENLCIYDLLLVLDIKSFYDRIYTHDLKALNHNDRFVSNMNKGATNGLLMGNYISLYLAESFLTDISNKLNEKFIQEKINCHFSYYSDDFYFFCNKNSKQSIISIFDKVLTEYGMERNEAKDKEWSYSTYNNYNQVEQYWKTILFRCEHHEKEAAEKGIFPQLYFINQLLYRIEKLPDEKLKRIFIVNFFKSSYFHQLDFRKYEFKKYNLHQLCFLMKEYPEILLYSTKLLKHYNLSTNRLFENFLKIRYEESLNYNFFEEQIYFYFILRKFKKRKILRSFSKKVLLSNNQLLISYYIMDNLFTDNQVSYLSELTEEKYWFQNYHLALYKKNDDINEAIKTYLIPKPQRISETQKETYFNFYKDNLSNNIPLLKPIEDVESEINEYIEKKIQERIEANEED